MTSVLTAYASMRPRVIAGGISRPAITVVGGDGLVSSTPSFVSSPFVVTGGASDSHVATQWRVATDPGFEAIVWSRAAGLAELAATVSPALADGTVFYAQCRYIGATYASEWSWAASFETIDIIPQAPVITAPADGAVDVEFPLAVTASAFLVDNGTDTHASTDWQVGRAEDFLELAAQSLGDEVNKTSWSIELGVLAASTEYWLRCRYIGAAQGPGPWSEAVSFTTIGGAVDNTPDAISWTLDSELDFGTYKLRVAGPETVAGLDTGVSIAVTVAPDAGNGATKMNVYLNDVNQGDTVILPRSFTVTNGDTIELRPQNSTPSPVTASWVLTNDTRAEVWSTGTAELTAAVDNTPDAISWTIGSQLSFETYKTRSIGPETVLGLGSGVSIDVTAAPDAGNGATKMNVYLNGVNQGDTVILPRSFTVTNGDTIEFQPRNEGGAAVTAKWTLTNDTRGEAWSSGSASLAGVSDETPDAISWTIGSELDFGTYKLRVAGPETVAGLGSGVSISVTVAPDAGNGATKMNVYLNGVNQGDTVILPRTFTVTNGDTIELRPQNSGAAAVTAKWVVTNNALSEVWTSGSAALGGLLDETPDAISWSIGSELDFGTYKLRVAGPETVAGLGSGVSISVTAAPDAGNGATKMNVYLNGVNKGDTVILPRTFTVTNGDTIEFRPQNNTGGAVTAKWKLTNNTRGEEWSAGTAALSGSVDNTPDAISWTIGSELNFGSYTARSIGPETVAGLDAGVFISVTAAPDAGNGATKMNVWVNGVNQGDTVILPRSFSVQNGDTIEFQPRNASGGAVTAKWKLTNDTRGEAWSSGSASLSTA